VKIIASIEDPAVVGRILAHLAQRAVPSADVAPADALVAHRPRGPPWQGGLDLG
jgi:hypothetical protein